MTAVRSVLIVAATFAAFGGTLGCAGPNAANIALRKQLRDQQDEIAKFKRQIAVTTMPTSGPAGRPTLSPEQTESLVTVHGIRLGRLTGLDEQGLSVHVVPTDVDEDPIKAAGSITVDAYDLADSGRRVGQWAFDAKQTRALWNGTALRYEYVVPCPLADKPRREVTVKATFVDALTGRSFTQQTVVPPPAGS